ncbi:aminotransferase class I/II-fold pyridoxal phosphate-dependent enzyme [Flagellimonas sp.]|uniref:aminotransferase class I/II-fold pyridoxal phosphate-dependent enzyme n=1 Tax=Flagellimonas sp. TaxID=2058762 RepID=UPI003F4A649F
MPNFPKKLEKKLQKRRVENAFRELPQKQDLVDFSSNDYLGLARCERIAESAQKLLEQSKIKQHGATGSRLLTGNHPLYYDLETHLSDYYASESAVVFNSGYDANIGLFSSVPQKGDFVFYDELIHASIREGILMSNAKSYKFDHNDLESLKSKIKNSLSAEVRNPNTEVYIVTESVFSMDGDTPNLKEFAAFCGEQNFHLIVDEAHAVGVFGKGLVEEFGTSDAVFAKIITFGKALGCHGAAILGGKGLKEYLVNFARSLIYTTALPPHALALILESYAFLDENGSKRREQLRANIEFFKAEIQRLNLADSFIPSDSAIHCMLVQGNEKVKKLSKTLNQKGYDVMPILSPTVKIGEERLRFCLHSFNTKKEIENVLKTIREHL